MFKTVILTLACTLTLATDCFSADWFQFRGPDGNGVAQGTGFPTSWGAEKNVKWATGIPGQGWSSPVAGKGRIYLTSAIPKQTGEATGYTLTTICIDAGSGEIVWSTPVFEQKVDAPRIHGKNSHASPTPILAGKRLYVHFGHLGTACLGIDGKIIWTNTDVNYSPVHGNGGSPILVKDRLVFSVDGSKSAFIVALNAKDGAEAWRFDRESTSGRKFSFSTPAAVEVNGTTQIISPGSDVVHAVDLNDGSLIWKVSYTGYSVIPRPVIGHGMVFLSTSYDSPSVMAIKLDGKGDVTDTHVAWSLTRGAPHTPSLLLVDKELYMISDRGIATCLDATSGEIHWQQRVGKTYSASPVYADGKIYLQSEDGFGIVIKASTKYELVSTNSLGARTLASYGVDGNDLLIRTADQLYRITSE